jgi:hypothetical protein
MSRLIPNERTWIGFGLACADLEAPTEAEITAAVDLTCLIVSLNASATGNTVPTPAFCSLFETSVPGTSTATFTADFYRDDDPGVDGDAAWKALPRGQRGYFFISRFGGSGPAQIPMTGDDVEVWPVYIVSRAMTNMASNTAMTFTMTGSVPEVPAEDAVVAA